jgi:hypothetical protein
MGAQLCRGPVHVVYTSIARVGPAERARTYIAEARLLCQQSTDRSFRRQIGVHLLTYAVAVASLVCQHLEVR